MKFMNITIGRKTKHCNDKLPPNNVQCVNHYKDMFGKKYTAYISNIYDGDTFDATIKWNENTWLRFRCRMWGFDAPEIKTKNKEEKQKAIETKEFLIKELEKTEMMSEIRCLEFDKYGRLLIILYIPSVYPHHSINDLIVNKGLGYLYLGGNKENEKNESDKKIKNNKTNQ